MTEPRFGDDELKTEPRELHQSEKQRTGDNPRHPSPKPFFSRLLFFMFTPIP